MTDAVEEVARAIARSRGLDWDSIRSTVIKHNLRRDAEAAIVAHEATSRTSHGNLCPTCDGIGLVNVTAARSSGPGSGAVPLADMICTDCNGTGRR